MSTISAGCAGEDAPPPRAVFEIPRQEDAPFFDLPWPTDLRRDEEGRVDVRGFPNRTRNGTVALYLDAISTRVRGYSTMGAAYLRFTAPVDAAALPTTGAASLENDAAVFLMDVDPDSPTRGARHPATAVFVEEATIYWPGNTVAIRPILGAPLAPGRTYAAVATRALRSADGETFARDRDLEDLIGGGGDAAVGALRALYQPALDALAAAGVAADDVLSIAVFTTQDPTAELFAARDWIVASYLAPAAIDAQWRWIGTEDGYVRADGVYGPSPIFQSGDAPYEAEGSGEIVFDAGVPVVQAEHSPRFALTVPEGPPPPAGFPIVLYAHGTGGDFESFVDDGTAAEMASIGCAVLGIDQVLHGLRNPTGGSPDYLFFNFLNPLAARDNNRQAALDVVQQARFAATVEVPLRIINTGGDPVRFDPSRVYVFGHSQGGLNMPLFLAADDAAKGGVLSAAGGTLLVSIVEKKEPIDIAIAVQLFLRLPGGTTTAALSMERFVYEHPVLSLLQTWVDAADGSNYASYLFESPRAGHAADSVLQTQGQTDLYTTPNAGHSLAGAMRAPIVEPVQAPIEALTLAGVGSIPAPVRGNVAGGTATAGLVQVPDEGHFAVFRDADLRARVRSFMASFADGVPTLP